MKKWGFGVAAVALVSASLLGQGSAAAAPAPSVVPVVSDGQSVQPVVLELIGTNPLAAFLQCLGTGSLEAVCRA